MTDIEKIGLNEQWRSAQEDLAVEPLRCDLAKYGEYVTDFDLDDEEQAELLQTIWIIMAAFVDMGFGLDSVQILSSTNPDEKLCDSADQDLKRNELAANGVKHDE